MYKAKNIPAFEKRVYLSSPTMHGEELTYMEQAYRTNWMSTVGENIDTIEREVADYVGMKYAVALGCGTSSLHLSMRVAGIGPGTRAACSDMTFDATVNPVTYQGGEQVFIDTERDTWNMDPVALERAFTLYPDIKAVVMAHLYGSPAKMDEILEVCNRHGAVLIEDAAESLGATYKGRETGSFGAYNTVSFNGNKIITGSAGGMFLTNDKAAADSVRKWSTQSRDCAPWYQHTELGYNYRMSNVVAGVVRGQFPHLEEHLAQKKAIYERYRDAFADLPLTMNPFDEKNAKPNFWLSCILINEDAMCRQTRTDCTATYEKESGKTCPTEILEVLADHNAEGRPLWKPMHMQPIYRNRPFVMAHPYEDVGRDLFARGLCLPSDNKMTPEQQDRIIELVKSCFC